jgi:hypothetical protein
MEDGRYHRQQRLEIVRFDELYYHILQVPETKRTRSAHACDGLLSTRQNKAGENESVAGVVLLCSVGHPVTL